MNDMFGRLGEALSAMTAKQRVQVGVALVATLGLVWGFTLYANQVRYGVLFSNMAQEDAGSVVTALQEKQVDYRLSAGGTMIEVPVGRIDELRLDLAGDGLPPGGGVGFEIFDKPAFGLSDFVQNVNYRRALERELGRTIQSLASVEAARVHLALPPESPFANEERPPTASVMVRLRSGRNIANGRVQAITHLVASGVEGLDPANVSVIDASGLMLTGGSADEQGGMGGSQYEAKRDREKNLESTLVSLLEPIVGPGRVRARATVELNMTRVEKRQESFDPDVAVIRSQEKKKSKNQGGGGSGGIPGTASNLPGGGAAGGSSGNSAETQETVTNFELNKVVSTISEAVGNLTRQSVAVVVDHAPPPPDAAGSAGSPAQPVPRTPEEMNQITEIVRAAIGYDAGRGDVLNVENIPFERTVEEVVGGGFDVTGLLQRIMRFGSLPLAVLLLALFVIRPGITVLKSIAAGRSSDDAPPTVGELQARMRAQLGPGKVAALSTGGGSTLRQKLIEGINEDPQTAALVVRSWIKAKGEKKG